ncbi:MAG TPA: DUF3010 domain-containing protein [Rheinheimera sp.]|uniref:DUF3010 family protein n=1 Tax=Rheinheimera sp. TaxID=1869214 RepID=UPI000EBB1C89|nr:DUF3010 family protein [Rheinheimera sp.]HCU65972.1 DUF3010 domain-containing protein [Rheinheimera sp.]
MRVCGVEIKGSEIILCLMEMDNGLMVLPDCRQVRFPLLNDQDTEQMRKFQFSMAKLAEDYKISKFLVRERPQKGKFSGSAVGFKIEAALQLIPTVDTVICTNAAIKDKLARHPVPVDFRDTGLKAFQESAFITAYAYLIY